MTRAILIFSMIFLTIVTPALSQTPPSNSAADSTNNPCDDSRYNELRIRSLDDLTEREYAYFLQRDQACTEYQRIELEIEPQRKAVSTWPLWVIGSAVASTVIGAAIFVIGG